MTTKIVERLKTGIVKNVVPFGVEHLPEPPYTVVKPEKDPLDRGTLYRIIAHYLPGQNEFLKRYIMKDVFDLLDNFMAEMDTGNYNRLLTENDYTDIIIDNDDKTISMERVFLLPRIII